MSSSAQQQAKALVSNLLQGQSPTLAKAITLVESSRADHAAVADALLGEIMPRTGKALRIGISGVPGVGKSTFIEAFGKVLLKRYANLAVLTIDPTSPISGGSILGDKTRMEDLVRDARVFIRPSPSGGTLGGVARHTREAVLLCEAAGYEVIVIETVGVGQSETVVASMVDVFLTLQLPHGGDELQGIKKGILELADIVAITKADGAFLQAANISKAEHERALSLVRGHGRWNPPVLICSGLSGTGLDDIDQAIENFVKHQKKSGAFDQRRMQQSSEWFHSEVIALLKEKVFNRPAFSTVLASYELDVKSGKIPASTAARRVIEQILKN